MHLGSTPKGGRPRAKAVARAVRTAKAVRAEKVVKETRDARVAVGPTPHPQQDALARTPCAFGAGG